MFLFWFWNSCLHTTHTLHTLHTLPHQSFSAVAKTSLNCMYVAWWVMTGGVSLLCLLHVCLALHVDTTACVGMGQCFSRSPGLFSLCSGSFSFYDADETRWLLLSLLSIFKFFCHKFFFDYSHHSHLFLTFSLANNWSDLFPGTLMRMEVLPASGLPNLKTISC